MITGNTHFALATHVLTALALHRGTPLTSSTLAASVDTNAAFLRAVIGRLRDAGLIQTKLGAGGGSLLAADPTQITLLDVYRATEGTVKFRSHDCTGSTCSIAKAIPAVLKRLEGRIDDLLSRELAQISLADLVLEIQTA